MSNVIFVGVKNIYVLIQMFPIDISTDTLISLGLTSFVSEYTIDTIIHGFPYLSCTTAHPISKISHLSNNCHILCHRKHFPLWSYVSLYPSDILNLFDLIFTVTYEILGRVINISNIFYLGLKKNLHVTGVNRFSFYFILVQCHPLIMNCVLKYTYRLTIVPDWPT